MCFVLINLINLLSLNVSNVGHSKSTASAVVYFTFWGLLESLDSYRATLKINSAEVGQERCPGVSE